MSKSENKILNHMAWCTFFFFFCLNSLSSFVLWTRSLRPASDPWSPRRVPKSAGFIQRDRWSRQWGKNNNLQCLPSTDCHWKDTFSEGTREKKRGPLKMHGFPSDLWADLVPLSDTKTNKEVQTCQLHKQGYLATTVSREPGWCCTVVSQWM